LANIPTMTLPTSASTIIAINVPKMVKPAMNRSAVELLTPAPYPASLNPVKTATPVKTIIAKPTVAIPAAVNSFKELDSILLLGEHTNNDLTD